MPHGVTFHFIWPLEVWFNLYLLKNLMHRLLEYCADHLGSRQPMSSKISPGSVVIIPLRAKFSSLRGSHFCLPFPLLLIILSSFMFINLIHQLTHALHWFLCQGLPQFVLSWKANLNRLYCHVFKISIYLINVSSTYSSKFLVSHPLSSPWTTGNLGDKKPCYMYQIGPRKPWLPLEKS